MAGFKIPGPICGSNDNMSIDKGTMCLTETPLPGTFPGDSPRERMRKLAIPTLDAQKILALPNAGQKSRDLTAADYEAAAQSLGEGVEPALVLAFAEVESGGRSGVGSDGRPVIAYEGHVFRRYTQRKFDKTHPLLSYPYIKKAGPEWQTNNRDQATAWSTLEKALALHHEAALKACSWGMFQVMGFNHGECGHTTVDAFVQAMKAGATGQLEAFLAYCKRKPGMVVAMQKRDYVGMAMRYNGEDYGDYDKRIQRAYQKHAAP